MPEPHWILTSFFGACLGLLLPYLKVIILYFIGLTSRERFEGKWYKYHPSKVRNEIQIICAVWIIKKNITKRYIVEEFREVSGREKLIYKGVFVEEMGFWLIKLNGVSHKEEAYNRFKIPSSTEDNLLYGLYFGTGIDILSKAVAGPVIISRTQLSEEEAFNLLTMNTYISSKYKIISS